MVSAKVSVWFESAVAASFASVTTLPFTLFTVDPSKVDPTPKPSGTVEDAKVTVLLPVLLAATVSCPLGEYVSTLLATAMLALPASVTVSVPSPLGTMP